MATTFPIRARRLARVAAPLLFAAGLSGCSWMPGWVDPTTWIGDSGTPPADQSSNAAPDNGAASTGETASAPDLADIPAKPAAPSTPEEQKQVADSLAADRADAHYSAEALRGGTEPAAAPPPPPAPNPVAGNSAIATTPEADAGTGSDDNSTASASTEETASTPPSSPAGSPTASGTENGVASEASAPSANQVASTEPASPVTSAVPPPTAGMQATFAPSQAPALDPSVAQYVSAPVLAQYRASAAAAASSGIGSDEASSPSGHRRHRRKTSN